MANPCISKALPFIERLGSLTARTLEDTISRLKGKSTVYKNLNEFVKVEMEDFTKNYKKFMQSQDDSQLTPELFDLMKNNTKLQAIKLSETINAVEANVSYVKQMITDSDPSALTKLLGVDTSRSFRNVVGSLENFFEKLDNIDNFIHTRFKGIVDRNYNKLGKTRNANPDAIAEVKRLYSDTIAGGDGLKNYLKQKGLDSERDLFDALSVGHSEKDSVLDLYAKNYRDIQAEAEGILKTEFPSFQYPKSNVMRAQPDLNKVGNIDRDLFVNFMYNRLNKQTYLNVSEIDYINLGSKAEQRIIDGLKKQYDEILNGEFVPFSTDFAPRNWVFHSPDLEFEFHQRFGDDTGNLFFQSVKNQERLLRKAQRVSELGSNPKVVLKSVANQVYESYKDKIVVNGEQLKRSDVLAQSAKLEENYLSKFHHKNTMDENLSELNHNMQKLSSTILVGESFLRVPMDNVIRKGIVQSMMDDSSSLNTMMREGGFLLKNQVHNKTQKELSLLLEEMGHNINIQYVDMIAGSVTGAGSSGYTGKFNPMFKDNVRMKGIRKYINSQADIVQKWSGNERAYTNIRNSGYMTANKTLKMAFGKDWNGLQPKTKNKLKNLGLSEDHFNLFRSLDERVSEINGKSFNLGIDDNSFNKLTEKQLQPFVRGYGSISNARNRLKNQYKNMQKTYADELAPIVNFTGNLRKYDIKNTSGFVNLILSSVLKFGNITQTSYIGFMKNARLASGLNPNYAAGGIGTILPSSLEVLAKNPVMYGKLLTQVAAAGYITLWLKDLIRGREPRGVTVKTTAEAVLQNDTFGFLTSIASNSMYESGFFPDSSSALSDRLSSTYQFGQAVWDGDKEKAAKNFLKAKELAIPASRLWWLNHSINGVIKKQYGIGSTPYERNLKKTSLSKQLERYQNR